MHYIIDRNILLKKWRGGPAFYLLHDSSRRYPLTSDEYEFLRMCDGKTEIGKSFLADKLEAARMICPCEKGTESLFPGQIKEYENYFVENIDWNITDVCNYHCLHCFHSADNGMHVDAFTLEEAMRFLDEMTECGLTGVRLTGGEPTLHPNFREILQGIKDRDLRLRTLITNGSMLDEDLISFIKTLHPHTEIMISFDGIGYHDWLRQHKGAELQAKKAIRLCKNAGLRVFINMNVNRKNRCVMFNSVKMLADLGVDLIRIIKTTEVPRWQLNAGDQSLTIDEYYDFSDEFAKTYKNSGLQVPVWIWGSIFINPRRKAFSCYPVKTKTCNYREDFPICAALHQKPAVLANGEIVPCSPLAGIYEQRNIPKENVKKLGLKKVLSESSFASGLTLTVGQKLKENEKCRSCIYAKNCHGGCPVLSILFGGSFFSTDPFKCVFFEKGYYQKFCKAMEGWENLNPL